MMGFDDERVRDAFWAEEERRRAGDWQAALLAAVMELERGEAERAAAWARLRQALEELAAAVVEAFRPLVEGLETLGEEAVGALVAAWELIRVVEEARPPRHVNCRCGADRGVLPVERVDPVRAGRTRWWTRK